MNTRTQVVGLTVLVAAVVASGAVISGAATPWTDRSDILDGRQRMNADNAAKILNHPEMSSFALPAEAPPGLEYLTVVRTEGDAFEVASQQRGLFYALCDSNDDPDSACDAETAHVVRDEMIDGRRVRIAEIDLGVDADKITETPTATDRGAALEFWHTVELARGGTPAWVSELMQGSGTVEG